MGLIPRSRLFIVAGLACIGAADALLAIASSGEWAITFWVGAVGCIVAAVGYLPIIGSLARGFRSGGLAVATLSAANALRLVAAGGNGLDTVSFALVAAALAAATVLTFLRRIQRLLLLIHYVVLSGAAGGATLLVNDIINGAASQYAPHGLWLVGFLLAWMRLRRK